KTERIHGADRRLAPCHELCSGSRLASGCVHELRIFARQAGRPRQRLRPGSHLSRDLRAPVSAVGRDLERDPGALYSANLPTLGKQRRDLRRESADPATKDERQRLGLAVVSALVDENAGRSRHLAGPEISLPAADANEAEPVEIDVSVVAPLDVPEKDGF